MMDRDYPDLDYEFLRYTGVVSESQRRMKDFYLPFFEGRQKVLDLACGGGDFVEMLVEQGVSAVGVDFDPKACQAVRDKGLEVACQDVCEYLNQVAPNSVDGIFSAHLVEHLDYRHVLEMLELGLRALEPGGIILLVTPNVRSLYAHMESFYKHFGHVSFYHPELLCFFLDYVGFVNPQMGENPRATMPLLGRYSVADELQRMRFESIPHFSYERVLPVSSSNPLRKAFRAVKMFAVRMIVQPYIDQLITHINTLVAQVNMLEQQVGFRFSYIAELETQLYETLDRPDECFVYAYKPEENLADFAQNNH